MFAAALLMTLVSCASPKMVGPFIPGEAAPTATEVPQGTRFVLPDGREYELGCDAYIVDRNHLMGMQQLMELAFRRIQELEMQLQSSGRRSMPNDLGGTEF